MFKVINSVSNIKGGADYWIEDTDTGEVRVLRECDDLDMDNFDEFDFGTWAQPL